MFVCCLVGADARIRPRVDASIDPYNNVTLTNFGV